MGDVTAVMMDVITEKSGHSVTPMAVSVCTTPAAPSPLPLPYPVVASSVEGIGDAPMRTKIDGALIATVGSVLKTCHGNEPGTLKEVVSLNTTGPCFVVMGAPIILCELGMMGITGSPCMQNKAPTPGAGGNASDASGTGGAGSGGGGDGSGDGGDGGPSNAANGGGGGGGGSNSGASGPGASSGAADEHQCQDGHPIDVATGYVVDQATDVSLPGMIPLVWKRYYSSARRADKAATLGPGWAHGFEQRVVEEERTITLREAQGRSVYFAKIAPGESTFHRRERLTLHRDAGGGYRVVGLDDRQTRAFAPLRAGGPALLAAIRDAWDNAIRLEYDGERLARVIDTAGREVRVLWKQARVVRLEVRAEGRLEQWIDYGYSTSGCLTAAVDALGGADDYEYDRFDRMIAATIKTGTRFQYEYEANTGRCLKTWGPKGLYAIELHADRAAGTTRVDGEEPRLYTWNEHHLVTREALPNGDVLVERAYDGDAFLIAEVNGAGEGTQYWYDERGNRVRIVDASGNVTAIEYENDRPRRRINPDGLVTELAHDDKGALVGVAYPSGDRYALAYDERGRLTAVHGAEGTLRTFEYDAQHNVVAEVDARGARLAWTYDAMGRPVARTDAIGRTTRVTYDRLGRAAVVRFPDGTSTQRAYDGVGRIVRETDALGRTLSMEYAGMGVLTRLRQADGAEWTFAYTSKERLREVKNPRGEAYAFAYDEAGRPIEETTFDGRTTAYRWSDAGRLARIDHGDGSWRAFAYDRGGRLLAEDGSDGSRIEYRRDRMGRLLEAALQEDGRRIATLFERDALGQVLVERQGDRAIRFEYDARWRRTARVMPDGATTRYTYDALGALTSIEHDGHRLAIERDALGREAQRISGAAGVAIRTLYDAMDSIVEQRATAPIPGEAVPAALVQRRFQYDSAGRPTRVDDARWGSTSYAYAAADRLALAERGDLREVFEHDAAGALVAALEGLDRGKKAAPWKLAAGDRLEQTDRAKYAYDARGRRIGRRALRAEELTRYRWDVRDRLREVELPSGARVTMTYDAFGRRVEKRVEAPGAARPRSVEFVWDGDVIAAEIDSERGARAFVHSPGSFTPLLQVEQREVFTYVNDPLGTPKELIDSAGLVAWSAAHSAWGKVVETRADPRSEARRKQPIESPFRLLGQYADEETGLAATRFRYFDPEVGKWCSPDPLGWEGGTDAFGFDGSPTLMSDPLGLTGSPHPLTVIGGNQRDRVTPTAQALGAREIGGEWPAHLPLENPGATPAERRLRPDQIAANMDHNRQWIRERAAEGGPVVDIGEDPRRTGTSRFLTMERQELAAAGYTRSPMPVTAVRGTDGTRTPVPPGTHLWYPPRR